MTDNINKKKSRAGTFRKNVVEREYDILCRNLYTNEFESFKEKGETETVAAGKVPEGYEVIHVIERNKEE